MQYEDKRALSSVRLDHAFECLSAAEGLIDIGNYRSAANRSYYAVFHAMRAVLAFDEIDMKHHSGIIFEFRRLYIKTGVFEGFQRLVRFDAGVFADAFLTDEQDGGHGIAHGAQERALLAVELGHDVVSFYLSVG